MKTQIVLCVLLAVLTSAQNNNGLPVSGPLEPGGFSDSNAAEQAVEAAGRHPNATKSVTFTRTDNNTLETWVWGVNITDIPVPNRPSDLGTPSANSSEGLHIINTQWQLQWPGDNSSESLQSFLGQRNLSLFVNTLRISLPSNITSKYNDQDNGNCSAILGDQCTQSLVQAAVADGQMEYSGLEGCAGSLDAGRSNGQGVAFEINSNVTHALQPSGTLFFETSGTFTGSNLTLFKEAESSLYLLALDFKRGSTSSGGSSSGPSVLCQIIDQDAATSAAADWRQSKAALWSFVVLSTLFVI